MARWGSALPELSTEVDADDEDGDAKRSADCTYRELECLYFFEAGSPSSRFSVVTLTNVISASENEPLNLESE